MREMIAHYPVGSALDPTTVRAHGVDEMRVVAPLFTEDVVIEYPQSGEVAEETMRVLLTEMAFSAAELVSSGDTA